MLEIEIAQFMNCNDISILSVYLFYFIKGRSEELSHQLHLDPQHSLLGPPQVSAAELVDGLADLELSMLTSMFNQTTKGKIYPKIPLKLQNFLKNIIRDIPKKAKYRYWGNIIK